jgi:starch synthase (maltosyl-transferring)
MSSSANDPVGPARSEGMRIYNLFPLLAGTVADWRRELPRIAGMGFNTVLVNPFHLPGSSGSLYAVKDYYRLNPLLRGGASEPDDVLLERFTAGCRAHGLIAMMDLVVNHTARDSELVSRHPQWFAHEPGGGVRSPFAVDPANTTKVTVWTDLAEIDYRGDDAEVVAYFADVVRHYVSLGFHAFRCDAAYKVPAGVWRRLIGVAQEAVPQCIFAAETLGARAEEVPRLAGAGFGYFFNSSKWWDFESPWLLEQYEAFRRIAPSIAFPESHDTQRLAAELERSGARPETIERRYRQAYVFAAAFSTGVMMPMGYEFGWRRRLDVVKTRPETAEPRHFDLSSFIAEVNAMKRETPALNQEGPQRRLTPPDDQLVVLARSGVATDECAFVLVNTDDETASRVDSDLLLGALGDDRVALVDVTPGAARDGIDVRTPVEPLGARVLRGHRLAPASRLVERMRRAVGLVSGASILIEDVYPEIDGGRFPAKRTVGDTLEVWADIIRDGHEVLRAVLLHRHEACETWSETPMRLIDNDRWMGRVALTENARYAYVIEAWTDLFASWRAGALKKHEAGQDIVVDLAEGRALVAAAAERAEGVDRLQLERLLRKFADGDKAARAEIMLSRFLLYVMDRWPDRGDAVRCRNEFELVVDRPLARFGAWYEMFPRSQGRVPGESATFADCIARLADIRAMGFDVVYLPPIHPIGRVNRKGRDNSLTVAPGDPGSPYAIGSAEGGHRAVHSGLGGIDGFRRFVAATRAEGMEVALDFAIQCAPDHPWVGEHPDWFTFRPDGTIKYAENPPKKYQDIVNVDFHGRHGAALWRELLDVLLFWVAEGVKIFRVDNPHTKPLPFWEWVIREVQRRHPEVIFLAEAFTRPKLMRALAKVGFTQSYTYFTWRVTKEELASYGDELAHGPGKEYFRPNFFTNTPDILPVHLQQGGRPAFRIRLALAATLSPSYGIYNGFELCENRAIPGTEEYLHSEKYEYKVWDWDRPGHIKDDIARVNRIRRENPALQHLAGLRFHPADSDQVLFYGKRDGDGGSPIFVAVNLDPFAAHEATVEFPLAEMRIPEVETFTALELFTETEHRWRGARQRLRLDPAVNPAAIFRIAR